MNGRINLLGPKKCLQPRAPSDSTELSNEQISEAQGFWKELWETDGQCNPDQDKVKEWLEEDTMELNWTLVQWQCLYLNSL